MSYTIDQKGWVIRAIDANGTILGAAKVEQTRGVPEIARHAPERFRHLFPNAIQITEFEIRIPPSHEEFRAITDDMLTRIIWCARNKSHSAFVWFMFVFDQDVCRVICRRFKDLDRGFLWGKQL